MNWLRSTLRGEVSIADLAARRSAGSVAYELIDDATSTPVDAPNARLFRLCAWNAFALQTVAETLLDTDAEGDPKTAGYVPRSTLSFVAECLDRVPLWIGQAQVVRVDPAARIRASLPARLPLWHRDEPTREIELRGLRAAYEELQPRVESDLRAAPAPPQANRLLAEMTTSYDYACRLASQAAGAADRGEARWRLLTALEDAFVLGQLVAVPTLADVIDVAARREDLLPPGLHASWLEIEPGWRVVDREGTLLGMVERVRGDRATGEFLGIEVGGGLAARRLTIPADAIARIVSGTISVSHTRAELAYNPR